MRAFRLHRHRLDDRASRRELPKIVSGMGGTQAQVMSAAEISLWARTRDLGANEVERRLWDDRTLSRAWCMRRTLHLLPSGELAVFVRGSARRAEKEIRWTLRNWISEADLEKVLRAALAVLDAPVTRKALTEGICRRLDVPMRWEAAGGWGSRRKVPCVSLGHRYLPAGFILHLLGARAVVCSAPDEGPESTFVRADAWLPHWRDVPAEKAEEELLRRYLSSFGPATVHDFVAWTRMTVSDARQIWDRLSGELAPVDVDGWSAWLLKRDLGILSGSECTPPSVRLLPYFDSYLLGHMERGHLVASGHHEKVYRPQGWVAPVILVDGQVRGVWSYDRSDGILGVHLSPFGRLERAVLNSARAEAQQLGPFLGCRSVDVTLARPR